MTAQRNPFAYPKPITLDSLPDLFAHHRSRFGGFRMEGDGSGDGGDGGGAGDDGKGKGGSGGDGDYKPPQTQADLDRIIGERLARDREKNATEFAEYKRKAEEFDKAAEAAKTEQERAVDAARKEGESAARAESDRRYVKVKAEALAAQAGFRSLSDVNLLDLSGITVGDDGVVDSDAVKAKLKELSDADPWRIDDGRKPAPKPDRSQGGGGQTTTPSVDRGRDMYAERRGTKTS